MYVHPYFSLDKRRLKVRGSVLSMKESRWWCEKKKTALSFLLFERNHDGATN